MTLAILVNTGSGNELLPDEWRHQTITQTIVDLSSIRSSGIQDDVYRNTENIDPDINPMMWLKFAHFESQLYLSGDNELMIMINTASLNGRTWNGNDSDHSGYGLSQWEMTLLCSTISHWRSPYPEWSLNGRSSPIITTVSDVETWCFLCVNMWLIF